MDRQTLGEMDLPAHIWEPFAQSRAAFSSTSRGRRPPASII